MSASAYTQDNRKAKLTTQLGKDALLLLALSCTERLSESYTITIDAFSAEPQPIHTLLGTAIGVSFVSAGAPHMDRDFAGVLWEYSELDGADRGNTYRLVLRPQTEFMTLNKRNRIFQKKSVVDIATALLVGDYQVKLSGAYQPLEYCVQYQESDLAFVSRLLEYEGIYYYYDHAGTASKIVLIDDRNTHADLSPASVKVLPHDPMRVEPSIWSVTERRGIGPAKVTVSDYDFEAPSTDLLKSQAAAKVLGMPTGRSQQTGEGSAGTWSSSAEVYDFPAKYTSKMTADATRYSKVWLEAHRRRMARSFADGAVFAAAVGRRLALDFPGGASTEYLIVATNHDYTAPAWDSGGGEEAFASSLELMPAAEQYRPAHVTPRPRILGPQTALVVGPSGEEIYTDPYGRIKVQFFWDREGKKDENSSCFIRVVQAGAGQGWGSFALPRIGQEVVVEFLDGDPDRPLVTGAVYNATNTPPAALPDNKTQFGLKTRITKGGGGHNRLWFEDKKGSEVVWFRAEKDYDVHVLHGNETRLYSDGNRTTTFNTGNDEKIIDKGNLTTTITKGDETRSIETGKRTTTIKDNETLEVTSGNRATTIKMGNESLKVSMGNVTIDVDLGSHKTKAMQAIELTVGPSKFKMDPMSISMEAMNIKIDAKLMLEMKGLMIQSQASAMQIIKGGLVMIN
jgi:type VI secretion system secreted protein VgrG